MGHTLLCVNYDVLQLMNIHPPAIVLPHPQGYKFSGGLNLFSSMKKFNMKKLFLLT